MSVDPSLSEFWRRERAEELSRYLAQLAAVPPPDAWQPQARNALLWLHYYAVVGFEEGVYAESRRAQALGCTKPQLLEVFALSFINSGPRGMRAVALACDTWLDGYQPVPMDTPLFPEGWSPDPAALRSGIDFRDPDLSAREADLLRAWYRRWMGEVPPYVDFLVAYRPTLLKAYRNRWENAVRDGLPKQIVPYLTLHYEATRGSASGVRDALLLGRGFGLTKGQVIEALGWSLVYGGPGAIGLAHSAAGDVLGGWDDPR